MINDIQYSLLQYSVPLPIIQPSSAGGPEPDREKPNMLPAFIIMNTKS